MLPPSKPKLLIVDDEPRQVEGLCAVLRREGYQTVGVTSGEAALVELRASKFPLLLTDLQMPGMDGIALLRAAQACDPDLVGIVMTGHGTINTAVDAMKAGALDFVVKPFELSRILPVLCRALYVQRLRIENAGLQQRLSEHVAEVEAKNQALEAANKELEAFSHSVSHDLRAPLRAISGFSHALVEGFSAQMPAEAQRLLRTVTASAARMSQLIDDLLRFARLNQHALANRPVDLSTLVHEVLADLRKQQGARHVEVQVGDLPEAYGDPALLQQVFANLLSNAFKFTLRTEQPMIEVGCEQDKQSCIYFVRDNGAGFDMQQAERLFGVFQRLHSDAEFEGTGIGLSLVKRIIERHGGRIWVESEPGHGATFHFTISTLNTQRGKSKLQKT